ncbi:hypothetical protein SteCoe_3237 [Stentor coeruleus]|uniref:TNFR-Cys domain-containing protein n=1 Tax=Stentor coeruleus TaxID=5963 RepID=A0A1R2CXP7_9CILI|nr:hypothetical protein SteCoe_3237 [Stentor coeruleus]
MLLGALFASLISISFGLYNCIESSDDSCLACSTFLTRQVCTYYCPSLYSESKTDHIECSYSGSAPLLFFADFSKISNPTAEKSLPPLINPDNSNFLDSSQKSPLKTKDRGLYFSTNSYMYTDYQNATIAKIAPNNTVKVWILVESFGTFLGSYDSGNNLYYKISSESQGIITTIETCKSDPYTCGIYVQSNYAVYETAWVHIIMQLEFFYKQLVITTKINKSFYITTEFPLAENSLGSKKNFNYYWRLGDKESRFKGFIYMISIFNDIDNTPLYFIDPPICLSNKYWDGECFSCNPSCPTWPWCVRSSNCNICYSDSSNSCYGYDKNQNTGDDDCFKTKCIECTIKDYCTKAEIGYYTNLHLINNQDYYTSVDSFVDIWMNNYDMSKYMKSGDNEDTDYFHNPETDDYVAVPCRGYYFNGKAFGQTRLNHFFIPTFNIQAWIKGSSGPVLSKSSNFILFADGSLNIKLTSYDYLTSSTFTISGTLGSNWHNIIYKIQYKDFDTNIIRCIDSICEPIETYALKAFRDSLSLLKIGQSNKDYYNGFLLVIILGTYDNTYNWVEPENCLKSECDIDQLPNNNCDYCDDTCLYSCIENNHCGPCLDNNCEICSSITECQTCKSGYMLFDYKCVPIIMDCFYNNQLLSCTSCPNDMYLIEETCKYYCPTGYMDYLGLCLLIDTTVFDIDFADLLILDTIDVFTIGLNNENFYPYWDDNDPIPTKSRGYYFNGFTHMSALGLVLHHTFYYNSWIKVTGYGNLVSKYSYRSSFNIFVELNYFYCEVFNEHHGIGVGHFSSLSIWSFIECTLTYLSNFHSSTLMISYGGNILTTKSKDLFALQDNPNYGFYIGSYNYVKNFYKELSFQGFIWSMTIFNKELQRSYNYETTFCYGCEICSSNLICPDKCSNNTLDTSCLACDNCSYGCVRSGSCSLCNDVNCVECSTFSNCDLCAPGYIVENNIECVPCHESCGTCLNRTLYGCDTCMVGYIYYEDLFRCLPSELCPNGYKKNVSYFLPYSCIPGNELKIFGIVFDLIQNTLYDNISHYPLQSGETDAFYPYYESSDVIAAKDRGMYFNETSFMVFQGKNPSDLILAHTFTLSLWILINKDGKIFTRKDPDSIYLEISAKNGIETYLKTLNNTLTFSYKSELIYNSWHIIQILKQVFGDGESIKIYIDDSFQSFNYISYYKDPVHNISTFFGDSKLSFKGFLWSVNISNELALLKYSLNAYCLFPLNLETCIPSCPITMYYDLYSYECYNCLTRCKSCAYGSRCNLCSDSICLYCPDYNSCIQCKNFTDFIDGKCICKIGYFFDKNTEECVEINCFEGCVFCADNEVFSCLICAEGFVFIDGICEKVPTGYANVSINYEPVKAVVFKLKLDRLEGILYDSVSKVPVLTGNSQKFYPDYDDEDPIAAYQRGFYFDGVNSIMRMPTFKNYTSNPLILPPSWGVEIWFMPLQQGPLLYSNSSNTTLFIISLNSTQLTLDLFLADKGHILLNSSELISYNKWNNFYIFLNKTQSENQLTIYINKVLDKTISLGSGIFVNVFNNTSISIGGEQYSTYYSGFIYYIAFNIIDEFRNSQSDPDCLLWNNQFCLPECLISEYWLGPDYDQCESCPISCQNGCRNNLTCNICYDQLCENCLDFLDGSCIKCAENAANTELCTCQEPSNLYVIENRCVICKENEFYNETACAKCPDRCGKCDREKCFKCVENAKFSNTNCMCLLGYNGTEFCNKSILNVEAKITTTNNIILIFSSPLLSLSIDSISLTSCISLTFTLESWSKYQYYIITSFNDMIPTKCLVNITLNTLNIVSIYNGILELGFYSLNLYPQEIPTEAANVIIAAESQKTSESTTTASTATTLFVSLLNSNPATLWSFINTIQMVCFIGLTNIPLTPQFAGYLKGLRKYNSFPNIFKYFVSENGEKRPFKKAYEFGYKTSLLMLNNGSNFSAFSTMVMMLFVSLILRRFTHIKPFSIAFVKKIIEKLVSNYKYAAFIRFWITCYMELLAASIIAVILLDFSTIGAITNVITSSIIIVVSVLTPILCLIFTFKNHLEISDNTSQVVANWKTLYYEFKNDKGIASQLYYCIFFARRLVYITIQIFMQDYPILQVSLNVTLSSIVTFTQNLFYLLTFRPFNESLTNLSNILCESSITIIFVLIGISLTRDSEKLIDRIDSILVFLIKFIMNTQMGCSVLIFIKSVINYIKKRRNKVIPIEKCQMISSQTPTSKS